MAISVVHRIWEHAPYRGEKLLVLLALADWSNEDGICWPSLPTIAQKARLSRRGAQLIIQQLVSDGAINILSKGVGRGNLTRYQVIFGKGEADSPIVKGERRAPIKKAKQKAQKANHTAIKGEPERTPYKEGTVKEPLRNRHGADDMKWAEPFYVPFRDAWNRSYDPADYDGERKKADFVNLARTRSKHNGLLTDDNWRKAIVHYFQTPQASHTLGDLANRFVIFLKGPLDRFGKPSDAQSNPQRIVGQAAPQPGKYDHFGK